jgi:hypothetical protein
MATKKTTLIGSGLNLIGSAYGAAIGIVILVALIFPKLYGFYVSHNFVDYDEIRTVQVGTYYRDVIDKYGSPYRELSNKKSRKELEGFLDFLNDIEQQYGTDDTESAKTHKARLDMINHLTQLLESSHEIEGYVYRYKVEKSIDECVLYIRDGEVVFNL